MIEHIVLIVAWSLGILLILAAIISIAGGLYSLSVDNDGGSLFSALCITVVLGFFGGLSISWGQSIQADIQEAKAHPCIQWGNDYDHGKLGQVCVKRKQ